MRRIGNREAHEYIARRREFTSHTGSFRGEAHEPGRYLFTGRLGQSTVESVDSPSVSEADYVVFSYATPIGWHVPGQGWFVPETKYSPTTSNHQGQLRHGVRLG